MKANWVEKIREVGGRQKVGTVRRDLEDIWILGYPRSGENKKSGVNERSRVY